MNTMPVLTGLSTTQDNSTILLAAAADGGFALPPGVFPYSKPIVPSGNSCVITGAGSYQSVLQMTQPGQPGLEMIDGARLTLDGVGFTGPGGSGGTAPGLSITRKNNPNTFGLRFNDVVIQQFAGNGIDAPQANIIVSQFSKVTCESLGGFGFNITGVPGGAAGTSLQLSSCYAVACGLAGYYFQKMNYTALTGCGCDGCGAGYVFSACQGIALNACGTEGLTATGSGMINDGTSFRVDNCDGVDFGSGCWTYANSHLVLHVSGSSMNVRAERIGENTPLPVALGHTLIDSGSQFG
jgi:hypothetical protein